jgi:demethylmenaquinone methyltransferase/2-methoxy-6-polyprenyl-1,4-benzoquinol methylase
LTDSKTLSNTMSRILPRCHAAFLIPEHDTVERAAWRRPSTVVSTAPKVADRASAGLPSLLGPREFGAVPLGDLDPDSHLRDPARKQRYVTTLFDTIAPGYDRFTRLFSFGMDVEWKRRLAAWVMDVVGPGDVVLDLACGTGDVFGAVERLSGRAEIGRGPIAGADRPPKQGFPSPMIVGIDPSAQMLRLAADRLTDQPLDRSTAQPLISLLRADMMALPIRSGSAAAVTVGYGFRNTPDVRGALDEVARVLRPGGGLFSLDFFRPEFAAWRQAYLTYLRVAGRAVGRWWHAEPESYGYIARSLGHWLTPGEFEQILQASGFRIERVSRHLGGGICLHAARRNG